MSEYIGEVGKRITVTLKLVNEFEFSKWFGWQEQITTIFKMEDEAGNLLVWKTTGLGLGIDRENERGDWFFESVRKGDLFTCKATVKEHSEYKGEKQTVLTRVKVVSIDKRMPTKEELEAAKAEEQRASLKGNDFLWTMPYRQYKEHYADCETLAGSFRQEKHDNAEITVIIREGRLVPSGVRGKHFSGYRFKCNDGRYGFATYRAVSEENARKQLLKDFPQGADWPCVEIYR